MDCMAGSAKRWSIGCVNAAGKARQKRYAKVTKPGACLLAKPCTLLLVDPLPSLCRHHMYMTPNGRREGISPFDRGRLLFDIKRRME